MSVDLPVSRIGVFPYEIAILLHCCANRHDGESPADHPAVQLTLVNSESELITIGRPDIVGAPSFDNHADAANWATDWLQESDFGNVVALFDLVNKKIETG